MKEKYIIYKQETETSRRYVYTIYRNSISDSKDIGDAIEFDNKELAVSMCDYLSKREHDDFKVLCIKITFEEVE